MNATITEFHQKWKQDLLALGVQIPETARGFGSLHEACMRNGALATKDKELIALAIGITQGCTECIYLHAVGALKAGASREQVLEAAGVGVMMGGGPAFVHLPEVMAALEPIPNL